jgi:hypothetical protein
MRGRCFLNTLFAARYSVAETADNNSDMHS